MKDYVNPKSLANEFIIIKLMLMVYMRHSPGKAAGLLQLKISYKITTIVKDNERNKKICSVIKECDKFKTEFQGVMKSK